MIGSTAHDAPSDTDPSPPPPTARVAAPAAPVDEDDSEIETLRHRILEFEGQIAAEPMAEQRAVEQVPIPSNDTSFATPSDGPTKVEPPPGLSAVATELPMPPSDPAIVTADDYESNDGVLHISYARHEHQVEGAAPVDSPGDPSSSSSSSSSSILHPRQEEEEEGEEAKECIDIIVRSSGSTCEGHGQEAGQLAHDRAVRCMAPCSPPGRGWLMRRT